MTTQQLADYLRVHYKSLLKYLKDDYKDMPRKKVSGEYVFDIKEVMKYIENKFN